MNIALALAEHGRKLPPELLCRIMAAGHKHRRLILFGRSITPDGHLLHKSTFAREEIAAQQRKTIHFSIFPVEKQPTGLKCEQLCRIVRL